MVKKIFTILSIILFTAGGVWLYQATRCEGIKEYNPKTDKQFILNIFKDNWYWLISEYTTDFSAEYMLDNKASSQSSGKVGDLTIKTYHNKTCCPVGFVAYHMKMLYEGFILFLAVDQKYRGMGYASKLLSHAVEDLKKRGAIVIRLITRTTNYPAIKVYKNAGFKDYWTDGAFIRFEKAVS